MSPVTNRSLCCKGLPALHQRAIEARPVQMRHLQIADDQVIVSFFQPVEGFPAVEQRVDPVALLGHHVGNQLRHGGLVFHHENALRTQLAARTGLSAGTTATARGATAGSSPAKSKRGGGQRGQFDGQGGAVARLAFHADFSAVLLHDAVHDRKSQTRADARRFGREEWIENARDNLGWNPGTIVGDFHADAVAGKPPRADADAAMPMPPLRVPAWMACSALTIRLSTTCWS